MDDFIITCKDCKARLNTLESGNCYYVDKLLECCQITLNEHDKAESRQFAYMKACQESGYKI